MTSLLLSLVVTLWQIPNSGPTPTTAKKEVRAANKPNALVAFEQSRMRLKSGELTLTLVRNKSPWQGQKRHLRCVVAGRDLALFDDGPITGFLDGSNKPIRKQSGNLICGDEQWSLPRGEILAVRYRSKKDRDLRTHPRVAMMEPRILGMTAIYQDYGQIEDVLWTVGGEGGARRYRETQSDRLWHVVMNMPDFEYTWTIDPNKDWNAVRCTYSYKGTMREEAVVSLRRFGDVWFPQAVAYYSQGESSPHTIVEVESAEFNASHHRKRLAPKDIGIEPGMRYHYTDGYRDTTDAYATWTGDKGVTSEEFKQLGIKEGPAVLAHCARMRMTYATAQWDNLTETFIEDYTLTREQARSARSVLEECKARAAKEELPSDETLSRIEAEELRPRLAALLTSEQRARGVQFRHRDRP